MSIRKRNGRWQFRGRNPDGSHHERTFDRKADAERYGVEFESKKLRGEWTDPKLGRTTFAAWVDAWESTIVDLRPSTRERDLGIVRNHLVPKFGRVQLAKITTTAVKGWVAEWTSAATHSPATVRKAAQVLSKVLAAAVDEGLIPRNPAERVRLPVEQHGEMRFLDSAQLHELVEAVDAHYRSLVLTAALTGLRFGELAGLRVKHVDVLHRRITVREQLTEVGGSLRTGPPKTKTAIRSVSLPPTLTDLLTDIIAGTSSPDDLVFTSSGRQPLRRSNFRRRVWLPAVRRAGFDGLRFHDLRHTAVALAIQQGAHAKAIQTRLGHASITTTLDRYGHLFPELDAAIGEGLESVFEQRREPGSPASA